MRILISSEEKLRIGLNGPTPQVTEKFGVAFKDCDILHSVDLHNLIWIYKIVDKKRFMLACIEYGIRYKPFRENNA